MRDDQGTDKVNDVIKQNKKERVSFQIRFQTQEYQKTLIFVQTLWNIAYGECTESFQLAWKKKSRWENCQKDRDLLKLLGLINLVCNNGSTGTNKDEIYVNLAQAHKFYSFTQLPNQITAKYVQDIGDHYDTLKNRLGNFPYIEKLSSNLTTTVDKLTIYIIPKGEVNRQL